jgi:dihydrofolate reductase
MRRILVSNLISLDGFYEGPNDEIDFFVIDQEFLAYAAAMLDSVDTILFGRKTYQHMAAYWPTAPADAVAQKMNSLPKIVFSKTLQKADWNNSRLAKDDLVEEVNKLKQGPGGDMVVLGSATLASQLLQLGLIDEYRVLINPVLIGSGKPLFRGITERIKVKLLATRSLASGMVILSYGKARWLSAGS